MKVIWLLLKHRESVLKIIFLINLFHDTRHLCTRLGTDGTKAECHVVSQGENK